MIFYSVGLLRRHKELDHNVKQTVQNLILRFECDLQKQIVVLHVMDEDIAQQNVVNVNSRQVAKASWK